MSMMAPFVDAAVSVDETNFANTFLSYYTWGEAIGLGLDLTLRTRFPGKTLDDLMREMWRTHGSPEIPYRVADVEAALAHVTGDAAFARDFFDRYVRGREVVDYEALLAAAGIRFGPADPGRASLGPVALAPGEDGVVVRGPTLVATPLYGAGIDRDDELLSVGGRRVRRPDDVGTALEGKRPGAKVELRWISRGEEHRDTVTLVSDETLAGALDASASDDAKHFRGTWKGGHR
jgi:predicted metalloprotease with PDZ domain